MHRYMNTWKRWVGMGITCLVVPLIATPGYGAVEKISPLWLSLAPTTGAAPASECHDPETPISAISRKTGAGLRPTTAASQERSGQSAGFGQAGSERNPSQHESEHRPKPMRTYWLNTKSIAPGTEAFVRHPDGTVEKAALKTHDGGIQVSFALAMGEGPAHGGNTLYVVERLVVDTVLYVRVAQWLTIHHNCGWGHDHKFDKTRKNIQPLEQIPFQMVINDLWDGNFHSALMAGQIVSVQALADKKPVADAEITMQSEKGWTNTRHTSASGRTDFQLIRDSYPISWNVFKRDEMSSFKLTASYGFQEQGIYNGEAYQRVLYIATFPWRYYPAQIEYRSYAAGLGLTMLFALGSGVGVYSHREKRKRPYRQTVLDE